MVIVKSAQSHGSQENNFTLCFFLLSRQQKKKKKKTIEKQKLFNQGQTNVALSRVTEINNLHSFICY